MPYNIPIWSPSSTFQAARGFLLQRWLLHKQWSYLRQSRVLCHQNCRHFCQTGRRRINVSSAGCGDGRSPIRAPLSQHVEITAKFHGCSSQLALQPAIGQLRVQRAWEIVVGRQNNQAKLAKKLNVATFRREHRIDPQVQSIMIYSRTFELGYSVTFLGARPSDIASDVASCTLFSSTSMSNFCHCSRIRGLQSFFSENNDVFSFFIQQRLRTRFTKKEPDLSLGISMRQPFSLPAEKTQRSLLWEKTKQLKKCHLLLLPYPILVLLWPKSAFCVPYPPPPCHAFQTSSVPWSCFFMISENIVQKHGSRKTMEFSNRLLITFVVISQGKVSPPAHFVDSGRWGGRGWCRGESRGKEAEEV